MVSVACVGMSASGLVERRSSPTRRGLHWHLPISGRETFMRAIIIAMLMAIGIGLIGISGSTAAPASGAVLLRASSNILPVVPVRDSRGGFRRGPRGHRSVAGRPDHRLNRSDWSGGYLAGNRQRQRCLNVCYLRLGLCHWQQSGWEGPPSENPTTAAFCSNLFAMCTKACE